MTTTPKRLESVGTIAGRCGVSVEHVQYAAKSRGIQPYAVAGRVNVYDTSAIDAIEQALVEISKWGTPERTKRVKRTADKQPVRAAILAAGRGRIRETQTEVPSRQRNDAPVAAVV